MTQERNSRGRFKADNRNRYLAIGAASVLGAIAGLVGVRRFGLLDRLFPAKEGHAAPDLAVDEHPDGSARAPVDFRPDPTAPVSPGDREALRPATLN